MLSVVTFLWQPTPGYRSKFEGRHVDVLRRMVKRHYPEPHRFLCITDNPRGIREPDVEIYRLWQTFSNVRNPSGTKNPSCYRRLRVFARNAGDWLGERFVCLDLDCVITGDMRPIWNRPDDFVIWRSATAGNTYNGSMFMLRSGARAKVWETFDQTRSPMETRAARLFGSDQAWIAHCLGPNEKTWGLNDGVLSYRINVQPNRGKLPNNARVCFFHGRVDPWSSEAMRNDWVKTHYR